MVSIIITTLKEPETLPKAIQAFLDDIRNIEGETSPKGQMFEIIVVGPDEDTERIAKEFSEKHPTVKYLKDQGRGKPAALNLILKQAGGEILVLSDGDIRIEKGALEYLLAPFREKEVGAVSGRPMPINLRENLFGYWSHFLTNAAHQMRQADDWPCSGYLYAIRQGLVGQIPQNAFSEDAVITQIIRDKNYRVVYAPQAKVYVKYPNNFKDWLKQRVRSTGGYQQNLKSQISNLKSIRSFGQEIRDGIKLFFSYPKNLKEFYWTILLYLARICLWMVIFWNIKIRKREFAQIWQRVESTK